MSDHSRNPVGFPACGLVLSLMLLVCLLAGATTAQAADAAALQRTYDQLTALPHRLAGSEHGLAAGQIILDRLAEAGLTEASGHVVIQEVPLVHFHQNPEDCYLESNGQRFEMLALRPNGLALSVTPAAGITGRTVYLGRGTDADFRNRDLEGTIAVLEWNCGSSWLDAMMLGAKAVVILGPALADDAHRPWLGSDTPLPRFFMDRQQAREAGLLDGAAVTLFSKASWRPQVARNILVFLPAHEAAPASATIAMGSAYDTWGPIPLRATGTRQAANVAGLVEAAIALHREPAAMNVLVTFFDADAQGGIGQLALQMARLRHGSTHARQGLGPMAEQRVDEIGLLRERLVQLEDPLRIVSGVDRDREGDLEYQEIRGYIAQLYNLARDRRMDLRLEQIRLQRTIDQINRQIEAYRETSGDGQAPTHILRRLEAAESHFAQRGPVLEKLIDEVEVEYATLGNLRTAINEHRVPDGLMGLFQTLMSDRITRTHRRLQEATQEYELFEAYRALGERISLHPLLAMVFLDLAPGSQWPWTISAAEQPQVTTESFNRNRGVWQESSPLVAVVNPQALRWIEGVVPGEGPAALWSDFAGPVFDLVPDNPQAFAASAQALWTVILSSATAYWPDRGFPDETPADMAAYAPRFEQSLAFFRLLTQQSEVARTRPPINPSLHYATPHWLGSTQRRYTGNVVQGESGGEGTGGLPVSDAVVSSRPHFRVNPEAPSVMWGSLTYTTQEGTFSVLSDIHIRSTLMAATFDQQGQITGITHYRPAGGMARAGSWDSAGFHHTNVDNRLVLFSARAIMFWNPWRPFVAPAAMQLLDAVRDAEPRRLHLSMANQLATAWVDPLDRIKLLQNGMMALNNDPFDLTGIGYSSGPRPLDAPALAAHDTWLLNESRLANLREYGIQHNWLEQLHLDSLRQREMAEEAIERGETQLARAHYNLAAAYAAMVHQPVRGVTNDLIQAVIILLLLAIPCAFAVERLVVGTPNIYRQIGGFSFTFLLIFMILYLVHPAFRIATFPVVVLLAFIILILSSMVIAIMWGKFEYEVKQMQGVAIASHRSTRNFRDTIAAAVGLGISSMRRRPLRTALTTVTIMLLTFAVMFFGSISGDQGVRQLHLGPGAGTSQVEVYPAGAVTLAPETMRSFQALLDLNGQTFGRRWKVNSVEDAMPITVADRFTTIRAWTTVDPRDLQLYPELGEVFDGDVEAFTTEGGVFLPEVVRERLGLVPGQQLILDGDPRIFRGTFHPDRLQEVRTIGGAAWIPPDVQEMRLLLTQENPGDTQTVDMLMEQMPIAGFPLVDAYALALVHEPADPSEPLGANALIYIGNTDEAAQHAAGVMATLLDTRVTLDAYGQLSAVVYGPVITAGDWARLLVPLALGGLIVFSTMLSSVTDREREIFTFSSMGLAPAHVAVLFIAEAAMYAVIGGMGGYLLGQIFGTGVEMLARYDLVEAPAANYSSLGAMTTILVVMLTVLLSAVYPAIRASRSANPGIQRRWKMPPPVGDEHRVHFPFTVSRHDLMGLVAFLEEHFDSHRERSDGHFAADHVKVHHEDEGYELEAQVWLTPFDQGVSQAFRLYTTPSDIEGVDEVHLYMKRLAGPPSTWRRGNQIFVQEVRQQFIFWRTIDPQVQDHYRQMTMDRFEGGDDSTPPSSEHSQAQ